MSVRELLLYGILIPFSTVFVGYWATPIEPLNLNGVPVNMSKKPAWSLRWINSRQEPSLFEDLRELAERAVREA